MKCEAVHVYTPVCCRASSMFMLDKPCVMTASFVASQWSHLCQLILSTPGYHTEQGPTSGAMLASAWIGNGVLWTANGCIACQANALQANDECCHTTAVSGMSASWQGGLWQRWDINRVNEAPMLEGDASGYCGSNSGEGHCSSPLLDQGYNESTDRCVLEMKIFCYISIVEINGYCGVICNAILIFACLIGKVGLQKKIFVPLTHFFDRGAALANAGW